MVGLYTVRSQKETVKLNLWAIANDYHQLIRALTENLIVSRRATF